MAKGVFCSALTACKERHDKKRHDRKRHDNKRHGKKGYVGLSHRRGKQT